jgi:predicted HAD superfamily hydrolase
MILVVKECKCSNHSKHYQVSSNQDFVLYKYNCTSCYRHGIIEKIARW